MGMFFFSFYEVIVDFHGISESERHLSKKKVHNGLSFKVFKTFDWFCVGLVWSDHENDRAVA